MGRKKKRKREKERQKRKYPAGHKYEKLLAKRLLSSWPVARGVLFAPVKDEPEKLFPLAAATIVEARKNDFGPLDSLHMTCMRLLASVLGRREYISSPGLVNDSSSGVKI